MTSQTTQAIAPLDWVKSKDGKVITTSRIIAEVFDKEHYNVLKGIDNLEIPEDFRAVNFNASHYTSLQGKRMPEYEITRDGAMFLIMGFTGKEAAQWKIRFIEAFNAMESALREAAQNTRPSIAALPDGCLLITHLQGASVRQTKQGGRVLTHITDLLRYNELKGRATYLAKGRLRPFMVKAKVQHYSPAWYVTEEGIQFFLYEKSKGDFNPAYGKQLTMALSYSDEPTQNQIAYAYDVPTGHRAKSVSSMEDIELYWELERLHALAQNEGAEKYRQAVGEANDEMHNRGYKSIFELLNGANKAFDKKGGNKS